MSFCVREVASLDAEDVAGSASRYSQIGNAFEQNAFGIVLTTQSALEAAGEIFASHKEGLGKCAKAAGTVVKGLGVVGLGTSLWTTAGTTARLTKALFTKISQDADKWSKVRKESWKLGTHDVPQTLFFADTTLKFAKEIGITTLASKSLSTTGTVCDIVVSAHEAIENGKEIIKTIPPVLTQENPMGISMDKKEMLVAHRWKNVWELSKNIISIAIVIIAIVAFAHSAIFIFALSMIWLACVLATHIKSKDVQLIASRNGITRMA